MYERETHVVHAAIVIPTCMLGQPMAWLAEGHASRVYASRYSHHIRLLMTIAMNM